MQRHARRAKTPRINTPPRSATEKTVSKASAETPLPYSNTTGAAVVDVGVGADIHGAEVEEETFISCSLSVVDFEAIVCLFAGALKFPE